jgi:hypothetical protein
MPDETSPDQPRFQADEDWKAQARAEKRRLAEQEKAAEAPSAQAADAAEGTPATTAGPAETREHELPPADLLTLVNSLVMQTLLALGIYAPQGHEAGEPDLDLAKFHIDTLTMLEEKTRGNLSEDEKRALALALHDLRMRYIQAAS